MMEPVWICLASQITKDFIFTYPLLLFADGIMGAGPDELSYSDNDNHKVIPTVLTAMKDAGLVNERSFSVYFDYIKNQGDSRINGEITFGGGKVMCFNF